MLYICGDGMGLVITGQRSKSTFGANNGNNHDNRRDHDDFDGFS